MAHLSLKQMTDKLSSLGLKRRYKPLNDDANTERDAGEEIIKLDTRRPATFVDGFMRGADIDIYDDSTVRVWTSQKNKAMAIASSQGFRIRKLDGEAELYLPMARADEFLHGLGAKVKMNRVFTPEQKVELTARLSRARKEALAVPA
jgi:hypothetical protein